MKKKDDNLPVIFYTTGTEIDFSYYHFDNKFESVRQGLRQEKFTTKETEISYRVLGHWDEKGMLPKKTQNTTGWRRFTIVEAVWIEVIKRLRDFGFSLEKIAKVCEEVMVWNAKFKTYPYFEYFVVKAWVSNDDPYVLVFSDGRASVGFMSDIEATKIFTGSKDKLLISLKSILEDMGLTVTKAQELFNLSDAEVELLSEVRSGGNSEIKTHTNKDGKIKEIETTEVITDLEKLNQAYVAKKDKIYGKVTTQYEEGKPKSVYVTKRKRFGN